MLPPVQTVAGSRVILRYPLPRPRPYAPDLGVAWLVEPLLLTADLLPLSGACTQQQRKLPVALVDGSTLADSCLAQDSLCLEVSFTAPTEAGGYDLFFKVTKTEDPSFHLTLFYGTLRVLPGGAGTPRGSKIGKNPFVPAAGAPRQDI